jgi:uncharacterized membrane protein YeaQ/YmgE (transglycosylase-associated protein family)
LPTERRGLRASPVIAHQPRPLPGAPLQRRRTPKTAVLAKEANVNGESLIVFLLVGLLAGCLASIVVRGGGLGLVGDMVVGVIGSFVGGWLLGYLHIAHGSGFFGNLIGATVGAIILLAVLRLVNSRRGAYFR